MKTIVENAIVNVNNAIFEAKHCLTSFITDTENPLQERWSVFVEAPVCLKNHKPWVFNFTFPDGTKYECDYDAGYERYMVKDMVDIINDMKENEACETNFDGENMEDFPDSTNVAAFKEFILSQNLGSFCVDW